MAKQLIVSVNGREKKIAIIEDDKVSEFYIERGEQHQGIVGNIYKGRVMRVLPGMRVAFSQLSQRVILVWGKQDTTTPITKATALLALNPRAELEVFDFCRVMPEQEHPELFNALVKDVFAMSAKAKKLGS